MAWVCSKKEQGVGEAGEELTARFSPNPQSPIPSPQSPVPNSQTLGATSLRSPAALQVNPGKLPL
ncbi:hypothetical protein [Anabaena sp. CCY 9910]|uniref:hypothetical protein n=1 Tax=Anabaena sp. CCY 9910 TaxID=3103870 RepID=UPI0039E08F61